MKNKNTALSLVEVLVATMIISASIYGMLLALSAQQVADSRMRDAKVLRQLHYQLVREVLKNQRDNDIGYALSATPGGNAAAPWSLTSPALNGDTVQLAYTTSGLQSTGDYTIYSTLNLLRSGNPNSPVATSSIHFLYPYANSAGWKNVQP